MCRIKLCEPRTKADRVLCSVLPQEHAAQQRQPYWTEASHKRKHPPPADDDGASEQPRLAALKAAVTAAEAAVRVAEGDDVRAQCN